MAPLAVKRATLQENGRADPGAVIHRKTLYVENETLHFGDCKKMTKIGQCLQNTLNVA